MSWSFFHSPEGSERNIQIGRRVTADRHEKIAVASAKCAVALGLDLLT